MRKKAKESDTNKKVSNPMEKTIVLVGIIALFGILGFASYKLISSIFKQNEQDGGVIRYRVISNEKYGVIGKNGEEIVPCIYRIIGPFEEKLAVVVDQHEKYGYVDNDGRIIIPCRFDRAYEFNDGWGRVCWNGKYYFINPKGEFVFTEGYDHIYNYSCGIARVYLNGKYGYIDKKGKPITPIIYDRASDFEDDYAAVRIGQDLYIIDTTGKRKTYNRYQSFLELRGGEGKGFLAKQNGKWGYIDNDENVLIDFKYDEITCIPDYSGVESYLLVKNGDKYGAYDYRGKCLIPPLYDNILAYYGRFPSICVKDGKYGFAYSPDSFHYEDIYPQWGGEVYRVKEGGLYGIVGKEGEVIIPIAYQTIWYEKDDGVYIVEFVDDRWGIINENGSIVSVLSCDEIEGFEEGLSVICINDKYGYINKDGEIVIDAKYEVAEDFSEGYAAVKLNGKYGYIDTSGKTISGFRYDSAEEFENGTAIVGIGEGKWLLDASGELLTKQPYFFIGGIDFFPADYDNTRKYYDLLGDYEYN